MRVPADTHAVIWYLQGGGALSAKAGQVLREAAETDLIVVSAATLVDLWYLRCKQRDFTHEELRLIRDEVVNPEGDFVLAPVDLGVVDAFETIDAEALRDPWDRLITATAMSLELPGSSKLTGMRSQRITFRGRRVVLSVAGAGCLPPSCPVPCPGALHP